MIAEQAKKQSSKSITECLARFEAGSRIWITMASVKPRDDKAKGEYVVFENGNKEKKFK